MKNKTLLDHALVEYARGSAPWSALRKVAAGPAARHAGLIQIIQNGSTRRVDGMSDTAHAIYARAMELGWEDPNPECPSSASWCAKWRITKQASRVFETLEDTMQSATDYIVAYWS